MDSHLTLLLASTPYTLSYTLPLLIFSVLLTFAGSFLTLDRSRSFPAKSSTQDAAYASLPGAFDLKRKKPRFTWLLEGGVGGLGLGFVFGVHLSTFLALLIPATSSASPLSPKSFLAVWILSSIPTTVLGGRYRYAALVFGGIGGGTGIALGLSLILHPSLLPRQILLGVFATLLLVLVLVSALIPRLSHILLRPVLRVAASALGAFGLVLSIALLSKSPVSGWANVWERLWVENGDPKDWGTGKEKGLTAAWAVFWVVGIVVDWALRRWVGECPDEKWDSYLSKFVTDLPNHPDRAGTFQPLQSFWDKIFSSPLSKRGTDDTAFFLGPPPPKGEKIADDDMIFPSDKDMTLRNPSRPPGAAKMAPGGEALPLDAYYSIPPPPSTSPQFKLGKHKGMAKPRNSRGTLDLDAELDAKETTVPVPSGVAFLRKKTSSKGWKGLNGGKKKKKGDREASRKPVKFGTVDELSSSSSSESESELDKARAGVQVTEVALNVDGVDAKDKEKKGGVNDKPTRPWIITNQQPSYSSDVSTAPTLVEGRRVKSYTRAPLASSPAPVFPVPHLTASPKEDPRALADPVGEERVDIDYDKELERLQTKLRSMTGREFVYSSDEDASPARTRTSKPPSRKPSSSPSTTATPRTHHHQPRHPDTKDEWSPAFLSRHQQSQPHPHTQRRHTDRDVEVEEEMLVPPVAGALPVPATPSLIRAVDRIVEAQREVFGASKAAAAGATVTTKSPLNPSTRVEEEVKGLRIEEALGGEKKRKKEQQQNGHGHWDSFWNEVKVKAQS